MKFQICIIYLYFFNKVFSASVRYDFRKYESYSTRDGHAIFDPTEFNNGDTMYFKVTASSFKSDSLGYEYLDEIPDAYSFTYDNNKRTVKSYHKVDGDDDDEESVRFYKFEKSQNELGSLKGTYLIFYFDCEGKVEIENTEKDEGKINLILTIVFSVVGLIIIGIIAYFCFCRKKKEDSEDDNKSNENKNYNNNQQINNNDGNTPSQNYVSQNGIYSNQNLNNNYNYAQNNNTFNNYNYNKNNVTVYNSGNNIYSRDNNQSNNINNNYNYSKYNNNNMIYNNQTNNINTQNYSNTERVNVELTKPQNNNQNDIQYNVIPMNSNTNRQMP
jgi:hypothetical protein